MSRKKDDAVELAMYLITAYIASNPHAASEARRVIILYTALTCERIARVVGQVGLRARAAYDRMNA